MDVQKSYLYLGANINVGAVYTTRFAMSSVEIRNYVKRYVAVSDDFILVRQIHQDDARF